MRYFIRWSKFSPYWRTVIILAVLFALVSVLWLHRVPGLMGDEASEGQNVYELLQSDTITLQGERSYIGPAIDYLRVPFVGLFGYSALALRVPLWLISVATFFLGAQVFRRLFGEQAALFALVFVFFSLPYLTYQRLGWAITLFPFFALLILFLLLSRAPHRKLLAGFVAGLGVHTHIMFIPTLVGVSFSATIAWLGQNAKDGALPVLRRAASWWPALLGFWAAFATQFVILLQFTDDQGDPGAVAEAFTERLAALPTLLPLIVSGSSYVARYTGVEFSPLSIALSAGVLFALVLLAMLIARPRRLAWLWTVGLLAHLLVLMYMIDRFTLRYFLVFVLGVLVLAGVGLSGVLGKLKVPAVWQGRVSIGLALLFVALGLWSVFIPFLTTGGSTTDFSLGNRTNSAAALADTRGLVTCLAQAGSVTSENVHVYNRLLYLSHAGHGIDLLPERQKDEATLLVHYSRGKEASISAADRLCPELAHFVVERQSAE